MIKHDIGGLVYFTFSLLDEFNELVHAVSSRLGGVSTGAYNELNIGLHVGEDRKTVIENRKRLCGSMGIDYRGIVACRQVHGAAIAVVGENDRGRGALDYSSSISGRDGLISRARSVPIMILVADCVPILFLDPKGGAVGIAHGSWRGTLNGIARKTVKAMEREFNSRPWDILACIGPSIGPCCYDVGIDVVSLFKEARSDVADEIVSAGGNEKAKLDLWKANEIELLGVGLKEENIEVAGTCTSCNRDMFYSYRAEDKKTGRFGGIMMLKD